MSDHNTQLLYQILHSQERTLNHLIGPVMTLIEQLADAYAKVTQGDGGAALHAIVQNVEANTAALSAAVSANTVADTGAVSPVPVEAVAEPDPATPAAIEPDPLAPHPEA